MYKHTGRETNLSQKIIIRRKTCCKLYKKQVTVKFSSKNAEQVKPAFSPTSVVKDDRTIQRYADKIIFFLAILCENDSNAEGQALAKVLASETCHCVNISFEDKYI